MRCYFHLVSDQDTILDKTGVDVSDLAAAATEALQAVQELRDEGDAADQDWQGWQLEVTDGVGHLLLSIPLVPAPRQATFQMPQRIALLS